VVLRPVASQDLCQDGMQGLEELRSYGRVESAISRKLLTKDEADCGEYRQAAGVEKCEKRNMTARRFPPSWSVEN
jgi:hypothetical protein